MGSGGVLGSEGVLGSGGEEVSLYVLVVLNESERSRVGNRAS